MSVIIDGEEFHRTAEACRIAGTSKNTFLRWVREGVIADVALRDRRGWRIFSRTDLDRLKAEANRISEQTATKKDSHTTVRLTEIPGRGVLKEKSVLPHNQAGNYAGENG